MDAATRLYSALVANPEVSEKDYFPREEEEPLMADRHARYVLQSSENTRRHNWITFNSSRVYY